jgi:hypothetical protein
MEIAASPALSTGANKGKSLSAKRRAIDPIDQEEDIFLHVKVRGDDNHRGFVTIRANDSLKVAREEISKSR